MTARGARTIRLIAAVALILVWPAAVMIPTHRASVRVGAELQTLEAALAETVGVLRQRVIACAPDRGRADHLPVLQFGEIEGRLSAARHRAAGAAFSVDTWYVDHAMDLGLPGTRGLSALYDVQLELGRYLSDFETGARICRDAANLDGVRLRDEERRTQQALVAHRGELEAFAPRLAEARSALEKDRPLLAAMAWGLGVIEVVGWALLLLVLRQEHRAWRGRRDTRA